MTETEEILARPDETFPEHIRKAEENLEKIPLPDETPYGDDYADLMSTIVRLHDFGKLTTWFQDYIRGGDVPRDKLRYHARVSAYITYESLQGQGFSTAASLAGFYAVRYHHSDIPNLSRSHNRHTLNKPATEHRLENVPKQVANIDENHHDIADDWIRDTTGGRLSWDEIPFEDTDELRNLLPPSALPPASPEREVFYPFVLRVWSTLNCVDKLSAAGVSTEREEPKPDHQRISFDNEASGVQRELNQLRTEARQQTSERVLQEHEDGNSIFRITLPTGFGKTFAGLEAALKLSEQKQGRTVYALPYTTVIDQIHGEVVDKLEADPSSEEYTIHHHLADTRTSLEDQEPSDGSEVLYGESWQAGLVLTTFVQLFESLAGPKNTQSIKLPALQDSVILLDEPQALPRRWWHLISRLCTVLVEEYDASIILMTATQPQFLEEFNIDLDPIELSPADRCFEFLEENERVTFEIDDSVVGPGEERGDPLSVREAAVRLVGETEGDSNALAVNNTVSSAAALSDEIEYALDAEGVEAVRLGDHAREFYDSNSSRVLSSIQGDGDPFPELVSEFLSGVELPSGEWAAVVSLSAALRPCDRRLLIESIRQITAPEFETPFDSRPLFVSATQLVEAGVDLSFDRVYRDFAPIPSLVQSAGRCNRSFEGEKGRVVAWRLEHDGYLPSRAVYAREEDLLLPAFSSLEEFLSEGESVISESRMVSDVVSSYYENLHSTDETEDENDSLVRDMVEGKAETLREESLVESDSKDCLVILSDEDERLVREYVEAKEKTLAERGGQSDFDTLKHLFASVPEERLSELGTSSQFDIEEFEVLDSRGKDVYSVRSGLGLRDSQ